MSKEQKILNLRGALALVEQYEKAISQLHRPNRDMTELEISIHRTALETINKMKEGKKAIVFELYELGAL